MWDLTSPLKPTFPALEGRFLTTEPPGKSQGWLHCASVTDFLLDFVLCLLCLLNRRCMFNPWVRKIPWRKKWQLTPVFLPGESLWTEEPGRLQSMGLQRAWHDSAINTATTASPATGASPSGSSTWSSAAPELLQHCLLFLSSHVVEACGRSSFLLCQPLVYFTITMILSSPPSAVLLILVPCVCFGFCIPG